MKKQSKRNEPLFEVVIPTGIGSPIDELYDDCPLCQELKRAIEAGEMESVRIPIESED